MKLLPNFVKIAMPLVFIMALPFLAGAQNDKKENRQALIRQLVESQNYVFQAQSAMPLGGRVHQLTSDYTMNITKGIIVSYLPYFGRAYAAPMDLTNGGIQFTSKDFDYTSKPGKKDGWDVQIKPKDYRDVQQMTLSISSDGYAYLQVTSLNWQPITFNGIVVAPKKR